MTRRVCLLLPWLIIGLDLGLVEGAESRGSLRQIPNNSSSACSNVEYRPSGKAHCCNKCPRGHYVHTDCVMEGSRTTCKPCQQGRFLAFENSLKKCKSCTVCDDYRMSQIEEGNCTSTTDRKCGCPSRMFRYYLDSVIFMCKPCAVCNETGLLIACKRDTDAVCGCKAGFFQYQEKCLPCDRCKDQSLCSLCPVQRTYVDRILAVVSCSVVVLMVLGLVIYFLRKKEHTCILHRWQAVQTNTSYNAAETGTEVGTGPDFTTPIQEEGAILPSISAAPPHGNKLPDCVQSAGYTPLPNCQRVTYTIVDLVPAFRWREFVRRLGLADVAIERAEMEAAPRYREAQYLMLRDWRQKQGVQGASLERVYAALRSMDLTHCAEQLQAALCTGV